MPTLEFSQPPVPPCSSSLVPADSYSDEQMQDEALDDISDHMAENSTVNLTCLRTLDRLITLASTSDGASVALRFNDTLIEDIKGLHSSQSQTDKLFFTRIYDLSVDF